MLALLSTLLLFCLGCYLIFNAERIFYKRQSLKYRVMASCLANDRHVEGREDKIINFVDSAVAAKARMIRDVYTNGSRKAKYKHFPELHIIVINKKLRNMSVFTRAKVCATRFILRVLQRNRFILNGGINNVSVKEDRAIQTRNIYNINDR